MFRKLGFQTLEQKRLLAADVSLSDSGKLSIQGDDTANDVIIFRNADQVVVDADGERSSFSADLVKSIYFRGRDGDDVVVNDTDIPTKMFGNNGNDRLVGGSDVDDLRGGPGNDELSGRGGDDELHGDHGNDTLDGGAGHDDVRGWYGDDLLRGGAGHDYLSGYLGDDTIEGGSGNDVLKGHEGNDRLFGQMGNDKIYGWKGNDWIQGDEGNDYLSGWSGDDVILGGNGNDILRGHAGRDLLIGGRGSDSLQGGSDFDLMFGGHLSEDRYGLLDDVSAVWSAYAVAEVNVGQLANRFGLNTKRAERSLETILLDLHEKITGADAPRTVLGRGRGVGRGSSF